MKVVDEKPVPIYQTKCPECKSIIEYMASEVHFTGYITCPVCGMSVWASKIMPKRYTDAEKIGDGYYIKWVNNEHTKEVEPVKRGRWEPHPSEREWDICSYCHLGTKRREYGRNDAGAEWFTEQSYTYCPWCGAKMSEGSEE